MTSPRSPSARSILRGQTIAFSCLLVLIWTAELLHLPHHLFGDSPDIQWLRVLFRTFVVLGIWLIVHQTTSRLLKRLHELETFLRVCGWCRKVDDRGEWRTLEDYFDTRFQTGTSHGICPECAKTQLARHRAATREASDTKPQS
ncbi:MAG: hypothetical protein H7067_13005 [Burkholderiales bacterium]|nr:hypothetical protein [Opitutaceae bacterium]